LFTFAWALTPTIVVNGREAPNAHWGRTVIPAPPGQYQVCVHVPQKVALPPRLGRADCTIDVEPGQVVELDYKSPLWNYSRGSLGPPPQKYRGVAAVVVMAAMLLLIMVWLGFALGAGGGQSASRSTAHQPLGVSRFAAHQATDPA
jgi:hypothetical protein